MVKNSIKVYARLKRSKHPSKHKNYDIFTKADHQEISFKTDGNTDYGFYKNCKLKFRYTSVFDQTCTQKDIFQNIAEPVVNSVLQGYNGTIFAYGQTGTGKTYSITGSSDYESRGLIPRTIHHIFEHVEKNPNVIYNIYVSYLEIYNELAYDLLNPKHRATKLEDLPRVTILEDAKGEIHLRNLNVMPVSSEREAMCFLFLGDTNRTIAETPMNLYSSRSHCIFTIHVAASMTSGSRVRRSKLHLVDLAGSERVLKSNISGALLKDAKQINLSLHYLEQVIVALSDAKRAHVPYRNSIMTNVLRDSLGGNCLTAMLATLSSEAKNFEETVSTCKFSQRVALVNTEAYINEEEDPKLEISKLKAEIEYLRNELAQYKNNKNSQHFNNVQSPKSITPRSPEDIELDINKYLDNSTNIMPISDANANIQMYFKIFKRIVLSQRKIHEEKLSQKVNKIDTSQYEEIIKRKDNELSILINLLDKEKSKPTKVEEVDTSNDFLHNILFDSPANRNFSPNKQKEFATFMKIGDNKNQITSLANALKRKFEVAQKISNCITMCKDNIVNIKQKIQQSINEPSENKTMFLAHLKSQQEIYRENILELQNLKTDIDHVKHSLAQEKVRIFHRFNNWLQTKTQPEVPSSYTRSYFNKQPNSFQDSEIPSNLKLDSLFACIDSDNSFIYSNDLTNHSKNLDYQQNDTVLSPHPDYDIFPKLDDSSKIYFNAPPTCKTNFNMSQAEKSKKYFPNYKPTTNENSSYQSNKLKHKNGIFKSFTDDRKSPSYIQPKICTSENNDEQKRIENISKQSELFGLFVDNPRNYTKNSIDEYSVNKPLIYNNDIREKPCRIPEKIETKPEPIFSKTPQSRIIEESIPEKLSKSVKIPENISCPNIVENIKNSYEKELNSSETLTDLEKSPQLESATQISEDYLEDIPLTGDPEVDAEIIAFYKRQHLTANYNK